MRIVLAFYLVVSMCAMAGPAQLNIDGFASCLFQGHAVEKADLNFLRDAYHFSERDLLLEFLALYPGKIFTGFPRERQERARENWSRAFHHEESSLARALFDKAHDGPVVPMDLWRESFRYCKNDAMCASVVSHNILRTLGRHGESIVEHRNYNPSWFVNDFAMWEERIPVIQRALISLRADGGGDRWGEWYHFFGILTFAVRAQALDQGRAPVQLVVQMNRYLNRAITGSDEAKEKAQLDQDAVDVTEKYLTNQITGPFVDCSQRDAYVAKTTR